MFINFHQFSIINHPFWGTPIYGNLQIYRWMGFVRPLYLTTTWCSLPGFLDGAKMALWPALTHCAKCPQCFEILVIALTALTYCYIYIYIHIVPLVLVRGNYLRLLDLLKMMCECDVAATWTKSSLWFSSSKLQDLPLAALAIGRGSWRP